MDKFSSPLRRLSPPRTRNQSSTQPKELFQHLSRRRPANINMIFARPLYCKLSEQRKASLKIVNKAEDRSASKKPSCTDRTLSPHSFMLIGRDEHSLSVLPDTRRRRKSALTLLFHHRKKPPECAYLVKEEPKHDQKLLTTYQKKQQEEFIRKRFVSKTPEVESQEHLERSHRQRSVSALKISPKSDFTISRRPVQRQVTVLPTLRPARPAAHHLRDDPEAALGPW